MRLTLHIGTEKTGTTSIQAALASDRPRLAERGILYPTLFGSSNHMELVVAARNGDAIDELAMIELQRQNCSLDEYRGRLSDRIRSEIAAGNFSHIIVSNEHCHSRLPNPDAIRRLVGLFPVAVNDCNVIVYLRRQDRLAVSLYSTILKLGGSGTIFPSGRAGVLPRYFNFEGLLDDYAEVFGSDRIQVRVYEPRQLLGGDVVRDFYDSAALGTEPSSAPRANESLSRAQACFLKRFNERFPMIQDGKMNQERGPIFQAIRKVATGTPFQPGRGAAEAFYSNFREANERVRQRYLPNLKRDTLFDEDFSDLPEVASDWALDEGEYFDFISAIWRFKNPS